jgi:hypothetical protein
MIQRLLCFIGWHDWEYLARENYTRLFRRCKHKGCKKRQELKHDYVLGPSEYWQ